MAVRAFTRCITALSDHTRFCSVRLLFFLSHPVGPPFQLFVLPLFSLSCHHSNNPATVQINCKNSRIVIFRPRAPSPHLCSLRLPGMSGLIMSFNFPKPENVLRTANGASRFVFQISAQRLELCLTRPSRAPDLIAVGKEDAALETLHTVLIPRKNRTWSDVYEQLMMKCVGNLHSSPPPTPTCWYPIPCADTSSSRCACARTSRTVCTSTARSANRATSTIRWKV